MDAIQMKEGAITPLAGNHDKTLFLMFPLRVDHLTPHLWPEISIRVCSNVTKPLENPRGKTYLTVNGPDYSLFLNPESPGSRRPLQQPCFLQHPNPHHPVLLLLLNGAGHVV